MILQLTKQSTAQEIKAYFEEVLNLSKDSKDFPVNLDDVWPLVYSAKEKAVRALKSNDLFLQNVDYQVLAQNGENSGVLAQNGGKVPNGRPTETYMLSVPCLEFFIARKVRPVFEVYRQVFHKVASGEPPLRMPNYISGNTEGNVGTVGAFSCKHHGEVRPRGERQQGTEGNHRTHGGLRGVLHALPPEGG